LGKLQDGFDALGIQQLIGNGIDYLALIFLKKNQLSLNIFLPLIHEETCLSPRLAISYTIKPSI
jgi:hypothetical protein